MAVSHSYMETFPKLEIESKINLSKEDIKDYSQKIMSRQQECEL